MNHEQTFDCERTFCKTMNHEQTFDRERTFCKTMDYEQTIGKTVCSWNRLDFVPSGTRALNIPSLPAGKDKYFFVSYSSEDSERVYSYVEELEQRFNLSCVYAERDFQPGKDIAENVKDGMATSLKVLLFLSPNFHASPWCRFEREFAFITSIENGVNCVIPVMLEKCTVPTTLVSLTYVDATSQDVDVAQRIASALVQTFTTSGFLPQNLTSALSSYENGYTLTLAGERHRTCCFCRPARYRFKTTMELYNTLRQHKIEIPSPLLEKSVRFINKSSIMWSYDYMKICNICVWSLMSLPFFFFLILFVGMMQELSQATKFPLTYEESSELTTKLGLMIIFFIPAVIILLIVLLCCVPRCCRRKKRYTSLQRKLWKLYADEYVRHNVLVVLSHRKNAPQLHIMRYNISSCKEYLERIIKDKYPSMDKLNTELHADFLIKDHVSEIIPHLVDDFDSLPEAPYNRHNVRKGKMCLCQRLEQVV